MTRIVNGLIACANRTPLAIALYLGVVLAAALGVSALEGWGAGSTSRCNTGLLEGP